MKVLRVLVIAVVLIAAFSPVCRADSMRYVILGPEGLHLDCTFDTPGTYDIYALLTLDTPAKGMEFTLPEGYPALDQLSFQYPVSGDLETGAFMNFGNCLSGEITILFARVSVGGGNNCPWLIKGPGPYPSSQQSLPKLIGCDDVPRDIVPPCSADSPVLVSLPPILQRPYR
jgi:hypothetical protein